MSRSHARNGTSVRPCVHCWFCHGRKLLGLPLPRDRRLTQDRIVDEIDRYWQETRDSAGPEQIGAGSRRHS